MVRPRQAPLRAGEVLPYERNELLLSAAELSLFGVLSSALDKDYRVFPKVRVADAISVRGPLPKAEWQRAFNRISSKHFDFVICRASDMRIMWAIELDDRSHQQPSRIERDKFLEAVCSSAALPLMRIPARASYSVAELCTQLTTYARRENVFKPSNISAQQLDHLPQPHPEATLLCPKCSQPMARRTPRKGSRAGQQFWGCTRYPSCRGVIWDDAQQGPGAGAVDRAAQA